MHDIRPNLIIGYHGCDLKTRNALLKKPDTLSLSKNPYDWLGHGFYFWENNFDRALTWARDKKKRGEIKTPSVIGAVLHLGHCLDFLDSRYLKMLKSYYDAMVSDYKLLGYDLPKNIDLPQDAHKDKILRELDCSTIEYMHQTILDDILKDIKNKGYSDSNLFDSTRGVFTEGGPVFPGAGILEKTHIQICIRNPNCIKGFFLPRKEINFSTESFLK